MSYDEVQDRARAAAKGEKTFIIRTYLPAVDAALWSFLEANDRTIIRPTRRALTLGSVEYQIELLPPPRVSRRLHIAAIQLQAFTPTITRLEIIERNDLLQLNVEDREIYVGSLILRIRVFLDGFDQQLQAIVDAADSLKRPAPNVDDAALVGLITSATQRVQSNVPRSPGAPPDPDNEWARREIELGRDRQEVFEEYLVRRNVTKEDSRAVSQARERFKKAVAGIGKGRKR